MPRQRKENNGNGSHPPEKPPSGPPPGDGDAPEGEDPNEETARFIRQVMRGDLDQLEAKVTQQFEVLNTGIEGQFREFAAAVNQQFAEVAEVLRHIKQGGSASDRTGQETGDGQSQPEKPAKLEIGQAVAYALTHLEELGQGIGSVAQGYTQFKAANRQPDAVGLLNYIKATNPELLNLYAPNPLGNEFSTLFKNIYLKGLNDRAAIEMVKGGGDPLAVASATPGVLGASTPAEPSAVLGNLTEEEIDATLNQLMRLKVVRAAA